MKTNPLKNLKLDKYEQEIENALNENKIKSIPNLARTKKLFQKASQNYLELQKTKRITIRVKQEDLLKVKAKAAHTQIPYQTLLNSLIHQFAQGKAQINI